MKRVDKRLLLGFHEPSWAAFWLSQLYVAVFTLILGGVWWALADGRYAVLVPLVLVQAFVMQAYLIAFHEAAHGALCPVAAVNGYLGRTAALFSFSSLTLYRAAHHWHHAYIGDTRDEEFWPLNDPGVPRWKRRAAAALELTCGMLWTPLLFLRTFLRRDTAIRNPAVRRMIWAELVAMALFWAAVTAAAVWFEVIPAFAVGFLLPAFVAGNAQSWRKYVEHVGLTGWRAAALTRSVRHRSRAGRAVAWLLFQEPFHDVHHLYPKVPQEALPALAAAEIPVPADRLVFPSYTAALRDLLHGLRDPKFGKAWVK